MSDGRRKSRLIVYARAPLPGRAKTRLGRLLGEEAAAGVYARLLYGYLLDVLRAEWTDTRIEISVASPADVPYFADAFPELRVRSQIEGDLGQRMAASFRRAFAEGAEAVVLTGSDVPGLSGQIVRAAFEALETAPGVVGPARDGGYYLLGMRAPGAPLFEGIAWSTDRVLAQTEALARTDQFELVHLPELFDVDDGEDFTRWRRQMMGG